PVDEGGTVTRDAGFAEVMQLAHELVGKLVIGIKRENPFAADQGQSEIALLRKAVEGAMHELRLRELRDQIERAVRAAAVDHDNSLRPFELVQNAHDVGRFVECDQKRRDFVDQEGRRPVQLLAWSWICASGSSEDERRGQWMSRYRIDARSI